MDPLDKKVYLVTGGFGAIVLFAVLGWWYYSLMWSEWFLAPVEGGMTRTQVQSILGLPRHSRTNAKGETWDYTRSWSRDARVYFDTNGVVWAKEMD